MLRGSAIAASAMTSSRGHHSSHRAFPWISSFGFLAPPHPLQRILPLEQERSWPEKTAMYMVWIKQIQQELGLARNMTCELNDCSWYIHKRHKTMPLLRPFDMRLAAMSCVGIKKNLMCWRKLSKVPRYPKNWFHFPEGTGLKKTSIKETQTRKNILNMSVFLPEVSSQKNTQYLTICPSQTSASLTKSLPQSSQPLFPEKNNRLMTSSPPLLLLHRGQPLSQCHPARGQKLGRQWAEVHWHHIWAPRDWRVLGHPPQGC